MDEKEKSFEIGQRVRIIGPTKYGYSVHIGKCFVIGDKELHGEYSTPGCHHTWPATSLELAPLVLDSIDFLHDPLPHGMSEIEVLAVRAVNHFNAIEKRLQALESKANSGATTDTPDELPELHVGDYVEVVGQPLVTFGLPVGTIDHVSHSLPPFGWILLECSSLWYPRRSLRKLSDNEIIAKIGWERKA